MNLRIILSDGDDDERGAPDMPLPHHKDGSDTERAAAREARAGAKNTRDQCLSYVRRHHPRPVSPDEAADFLGKDVARGVRARFNDLKELGLIEDSGLRGRNALNKSVILWRLTTKGQE